MSWTLTRVDFPKLEGGSKTIELQSAEQAIGPWTTIEQTMVLSEKAQEFLRLTRAKAWLSRTRVSLPFTALHALEVRNAFNLGVFRNLFTSAEGVAAWRNVENDLRSGRLVRTMIEWPVAFRFAARCSERHSATVGTRSLNLLHVAVAKTLRAVRVR